MREVLDKNQVEFYLSVFTPKGVTLNFYGTSFTPKSKKVAPVPSPVPIR